MCVDLLALSVRFMQKRSELHCRPSMTHNEEGIKEVLKRRDYAQHPAEKHHCLLTHLCLLEAPPRRIDYRTKPFFLKFL
jgi:hypothetical protein